MRIASSDSQDFILLSGNKKAQESLDTAKTKSSEAIDTAAQKSGVDAGVANTAKEQVDSGIDKVKAEIA